MPEIMERPLGSPAPSRVHKGRLASTPLARAALVAIMLAAFTVAAQPAEGGEAQLETGVTLAYEVFGEPQGEPLVLIAGTGMQLIDWPAALVEGLVEAGFRVIRYDNRDVGLSTNYDGVPVPGDEELAAAIGAGENPLPYDMSDMAADTMGLLDALGIERAHLVGVSMGGTIAQWAALEHPERVASLTLISADSGNIELPIVADPEAFAGMKPVPSDPTDTEAFVEYWLELGRALSGPGFAFDEGEVREAARRYHERWFDPEATVRQQTAVAADFYLRGMERYQRLPEIGAPTVVIHGEDDPLVPVESGVQLAERIPGAELVLVPGLGHDLPDELVPRLVQAIGDVAEKAP